MYVSLLLLYVSLEHVLNTQVDEQPYCSLRYRRLCQGKGRHVACEFPTNGPGPSCQNYTEINFTNELRHFITHYINRRRQRVASGSERVRGGAHLPRPELMMLVTWDKELAHLAQRLADQCFFVHDDCRATVRYPYAGQSVGEVRWRRSDELSAQRAVRRVLDAWWGERRRVQPEQLTTPFRLTAKGTVWGHFSQLAVWSLRAIGCAAVTHGRDYTRLLLVCDFSHTNMLGQKTISPGPMAPCPMHTARKSRSPYPLLCVPVKSPVPREPKEDPDKENDDDEIDEKEENEEHEETDQETQTPSISGNALVKKLKKINVKLNTRTSIPRMNTRYRVLVKDENPSNLMNPFEKDVELRSEQRQAVTGRNYHLWQTMSPYSEILREHKFGYFKDGQVRGERKWTMGEAQKKLMGMPIDLGSTRPNNRHKVIATIEDVSSHGALRHRWKQTRIRLERPGANALLNKGSQNNWKPSSMASLMLDKEDVDQLFQDTGFNMYWRQQN